MSNLFQSKTCPKCGKKFDPVLSSCPHCDEENDTYPARGNGFKKIFPLGHIREFILAISHMVIMKLVMYIVQLIMIAILYGKLGTQEAVTDWVKANLSALDFWLSVGGDLFVLAIVAVTMGKDLLEIWSSFKDPSVLIGIPLGIAMLIISAMWSGFAQSIIPGESNANSSGIAEIMNYSKFGAVFFVVILAPIIEELTYRVGLFNFLKRIHPAVAYIGVGLIFGFIHMQSLTDPVEWLYFPGYAFGGLALSFIYDKYGFGGSVLAHITNNGISIALSLIALNS